MGHLWMPDIPVWEKVLRSAVVYGFLLVAFRFAGKRQVGQLTPFDLVVLLIISNVVQNAVIGDDNSLGGGLLGAVVILLLNYGVVLLTYRYRPFRRLMAGEPSLLVHNGRVFHDRLGREHLTLEDLTAALRRSGVGDLSRVHYAILEDNGQISVIPRTDAPKGAPPAA